MNRFVDVKVQLFAKRPLPGHCKTRLIPALGPQGAAALHRKMVVHMFDILGKSGCLRVDLWKDSDAADPFWRDIDNQFRPRWHVQSGDNLGQRMQYALSQGYRQQPYRILLGTDCPAMTPYHISALLDALRHGVDAAFIPVEDGGYGAIALSSAAHWRLFRDIPWNTGAVMSCTRQQLQRLGWTWYETPMLWDVDTPEDLSRLKMLYPHWF